MLWISCDSLTGEGSISSFTCCWQHIVSWGLRDQDLHRPLWEVNRESLRVRQKLKPYVILIMEVISPQHWGILLVRSTLLENSGLGNSQSPEVRACWQSSEYLPDGVCSLMLKHIPFTANHLKLPSQNSLEYQLFTQYAPSLKSHI